MKTFTLLSALATACVFSAASAQEKKISSAPQPVPMTAPAMKTQNTQTSQQNSQTAPAPKQTGTTTETKKTENGKAAESAPAPAVDNKIAVSDPGTPGDKANTKKAAPQSTETKKASSTGVTPK